MLAARAVTSPSDAGDATGVATEEAGGEEAAAETEVEASPSDERNRRLSSSTARKVSRKVSTFKTHRHSDANPMAVFESMTQTSKGSSWTAMLFSLTANAEASRELFPSLAGKRVSECECSGRAFGAWLQGDEIEKSTDRRSLDAVLSLFSLLSSPLQLQSRTKTSTTGAVLDFRGLLRFFASGSTDMRIFKARAESDQSYLLDVKYTSPQLHTALEQTLTEQLELMSAENGHVMRPLRKIDGEGARFVLSAGSESGNVAETRTQARLTLEVGAKQMEDDATAVNALVSKGAEEILMELATNIAEQVEQVDPSTVPSDIRAHWKARPNTKYYNAQFWRRLSSTSPPVRCQAWPSASKGRS